MPEDTNPLDLTEEERVSLFKDSAERIKARLVGLESEFAKSHHMEEMALGGDFTSPGNNDGMVMTDGLPYMLNRETSSLMVACIANRSILASIHAVESDMELFQELENGYDDLIKIANKLLHLVVQAEENYSGE